MKKEKHNNQMTLAEYYNSLPSSTSPKTAFVKLVVMKCGISVQAFRRWINNGTMPSKKEYCDIVAEITEISAEVLFPLYRERYGKN